MKNIEPAIKEKFIEETLSLAYFIKDNPYKEYEVLRSLSITKDSAELLEYNSIHKLYVALEDIYKALCDNVIVLSDNLLYLIDVVCDKITLCANCIKEDKPFPNEEEIRQCVLYCDKAVANEIFDIDAIAKHHLGLTARVTEERNKSYTVKENKSITVQTEAISSVLTNHEELIARTYKIVNSIEELKVLSDNPEKNKIIELQRILAGDMQVLQNALLLVHDQMLTISGDETLSHHHTDFHGFFVYANEKKYIIPSDYIVDVVCESSLNYANEQNQIFYERPPDEEGGEIERIPVYSLSSLFPGTKKTVKSDLDTILLAEYQGQKIGIIVDVVHKFAYLVKKPMPAAFRNFPVYKGVSYDEKYNLVPILSVPEIMRRFRSLRGYDVKKFEAYTRRRKWRILIADDSETALQIENSIIRADTDFIVDSAKDGIIALEMARNKQYDLLITDDAMPRMNGEILLDNIRRLEQYEHLPVIALSEHPLEKADAFMSKSDFKRDELIQKVKELLHE